MPGLPLLCWIPFFFSPIRQRHNVKFQSVVIVVLFLVMASLGCTMEISKTKDHFWKHKGVAIAVAAQYGIMPPIAFALGKAFQLDPTEALAALICDCCPGGNLSNILSLASKGDMNLSVGLCSMATCLPPPHFYFQAGMIILLLSSVPIIALTVIHVGSRALLITFAPRLLATSALMPFIGFSLGYALEIFFNFSDPLETVFNFSDRLYAKMCSTILKIAFPPGVIGSLFLFPSMHLMFHLVEGLLTCVREQNFCEVGKQFITSTLLKFSATGSLWPELVGRSFNLLYPFNVSLVPDLSPLALLVMPEGKSKRKQLE
uniref:Solute carrier family 10 member 1 n=1 Tax=Varanus komodoensis TaxID=61221 RepID=A0A8D2IRA0_VARKO